MSRLVYGSDNRILQFIGDVLILVGNSILSLGLKWGGLYEWEIEDDEEEDV
jgi:hypothetical protein